MFTQFAFVQKINKEKVEVLVFPGNFVWSFGTGTGPVSKGTQDIFPFILQPVDKKPLICNKINAGDETKLTSYSGGLIFEETYSLPGGSLVCILLPHNYIPTMLKFIDKLEIPLYAETRNHKNPGHIQVHYNANTRQCGVSFNLTKTCSFGIKFGMKECTGNFPSGDATDLSDSYEDLISSFKKNEFITREVLTTNLKELDVPKKTLDDIYAILGKIHNNGIPVAQSKKRLSEKFSSIAGDTANILSILDSVAAKGAMLFVLSRLLTYIRM